MISKKELTKEDIKNQLSQYNSLQLEISDLTSKINKIEQKHRAIATVDGSLKDYPYSKVHYKITATSPVYAKEMNKHLEMLKERKIKSIQSLNNLEEFIKELPTSRLRLIFEYKYINQYTWPKIAFILKNGATAESIRKEHDRYFEKK